jgi:hypothetical protein
MKGHWGITMVSNRGSIPRETNQLHYGLLGIIINYCSTYYFL